MVFGTVAATADVLYPTAGGILAIRWVHISPMRARGRRTGRGRREEEAGWG